MAIGKAIMARITKKTENIPKRMEIPADISGELKIMRKSNCPVLSSVLSLSVESSIDLSHSLADI